MRAADFWNIRTVALLALAIQQCEASVKELVISFGHYARAGFVPDCKEISDQAHPDPAWRSNGGDGIGA